MTRLGDHEAGDRHLRVALRLFCRLEDAANMGHVHLTWAIADEQRDRLHDALRRSREALHYYRLASSRAALANALNAVGWYSSLLGRHQQALGPCQEALRLHQDLGNHSGEAATWHSLGHAHHQLRQYEQAITCYQHAVRMQKQLGDRYNLTIPLTHLGDVYAAIRDPQRAAHFWRQAFDILGQLRHPDAEQLRTRLECKTRT